jgi:hypothetical protein
LYKLIDYKHIVMPSFKKIFLLGIELGDYQVLTDLLLCVFRP